MIMAYGVQLFDANGNELVGRFIPAFVAAFISTPASGSREFPPLEGKTLIAEAQRLTAPSNPNVSGASATVSGNTVTWSGASADQPIIILYK